jgi:protein SCO1/2
VRCTTTAALSCALSCALVAALPGCPRDEGPRWPKIGAPVPALVGELPDGRPFRLAERLADGPVLLFFGYTWCPDVCPLTLLTAQRLRRALGPERAAQLGVVFVTVDPERDTTARLASYVEGFTMPLIAVRPRDLDATVETFRLSVETVKQEGAADPDGYLVNHTATVFFVGADGRLVARFEHGSSAEDMVAIVGPRLPAAPRPARRLESLSGLGAEDLVIRLAPGGATAALYGTLSSSIADTLLGVSSTVAAHLSLHETVVEGEVARMEPAERWPLGPDAPLQLRRGGRHVMFLRLRPELRPGQRVPIVLELERAGPVRLDVELRGLED